MLRKGRDRRDGEELYTCWLKPIERVSGYLAVAEHTDFFFLCRVLGICLRVLISCSRPSTVWPVNLFAPDSLA